MVQQKIRNKKIENTYINLDETENSSNSINSGGNKKRRNKQSLKMLTLCTPTIRMILRDMILLYEGYY